MKAMIMAAGKGTRLLPLTESMPKALIEIQGVALLEHTIKYLKYFGINDIIINIHHHSSQIVDFIEKNKSFNVNIAFSDESRKLLDTGGGLYKARWFFDKQEPFILTTSDVITNLNIYDLLSFHKENNPLVTLAVKHRKSSRDFIFDENNTLCGWHNNNSGETRIIRKTAEQKRIAFSGIHVIDPTIFKMVRERGSFSIIDLYLRLAADNIIMGYADDESDWIECGRIEHLQELGNRKEISEIYKKYHLPPEIK